MIRAALLFLLLVSGCAAPVLRQSVCFQPQQGVQFCQFAYEGDSAE